MPAHSALWPVTPDVPPEESPEESPDVSPDIDFELLAQLRAGDDAVALALQAGSAGIPTLLAMVGGEAGLDRSDSADLSALAGAIFALGWSGDARAVEPLCAALRERPLDPEVGSQVAWALQKLDAPPVDLYLALLDEQTDASQCAWLYAALARAGRRDERILGRLLEYLDQRPAEAAELLADYGDRRAIEPLRQALEAYEPDAAESPFAAAATLHAYDSALDRFDHRLSAQLRAGCDAVYRAACVEDDQKNGQKDGQKDGRKGGQKNEQQGDQVGSGRAAAPVRTRADGRRQKRRRKSKRKQQRASRKRNRRL